ncbi:hypothetical protein BVC80_7499g3 [Macleaya cordata]|uniref:Reverse transcriptase zinc-binding domain n=1 Tax=Macleaya cordata TaxID=56857 RepID=A0A200Q853_MACCD|nr:hypothetical protein BVC80_7499g3 [Macleaya cordata]
MRNFLWTGDHLIKKLVTKAWTKVCCPKGEGGLGLVRLEIINKALLSKLMWRILSSKDLWARFIRAKFSSRNGEWIQYYKPSSIWGGLLWAYNNMKEHLTWIEDFVIWKL